MAGSWALYQRQSVPSLLSVKGAKVSICDDVKVREHLMKQTLLRYHYAEMYIGGYMLPSSQCLFAHAVTAR